MNNPNVDVTFVLRIPLRITALPSKQAIKAGKSSSIQIVTNALIGKVNLPFRNLRYLD